MDGGREPWRGYGGGRWCGEVETHVGSGVGEGGEVFKISKRFFKSRGGRCTPGVVRRGRLRQPVVKF